MVFYIVSCAAIGYIGMSIVCEVLEINKKFPSAGNACIFIGTLVGASYGLSCDMPYLMANDELVDYSEHGSES